MTEQKPWELFWKAGENVREDNKKQDISEAVLCAEYEAVYRYALSLCRDDMEAQDITQETFLRAMKSVGKFEGNSSLYTWLCAIAKNLWLNNCKKYGREVMPDNMVVTGSTSAEPMVQKILDKETTIEIHRVLHDLQEPYKEVFSLRVFGQLSFSDIAGLFSKTESWARVTYHRARKMIEEKLRKDGYYE